MRFPVVCALLSAGLTFSGSEAISQDPSISPNRRESGVLEVGGTFVHSDGVRIADPTRSAPHSVQVWVELVDLASTVPLPTEYEPISSMYRIGASERVIARPGSFRISIPLAETIPNEKERLFIICLLNDGSVYTYPDREPTYQYSWREATTIVDLAEKLATIRFGDLDQEGTVFALVMKKD
jgi:hypothetical protein